MASTNFVVSSLPAYVQENRDLIIKNFALVGTATRKRITIQTGIKGSEHLNYLGLGVTLQDGSDCGFNAAGEVALTQRTITTALIKAQDDICPKKLRGKWAEYLISIAATENDLPFERYIVDTLIAEVNKKIEKLIWQGDTTLSTNTDLKWIDGFIAQFDADSDVVDVTLAYGTSAYNAIKAVYMALTDEAIERGAEIFVSPANYRAFLQDMVEKNYFHYSGPQDAAPEEFVFPGTEVKVVKTPGLVGVNNKIVGTWPKNLVYGCDAENDNEVVDLWWSQDDRVFKYDVEWNSGVSYYFPSHIVLGTIAAE